MSQLLSLHLGKDIGMDLGTANTFVYIKGKGIVVREPTVVALDKGDGRVLAVGNQANEMLGRTPENITAVRPMKDGVIADFDMTQSMLRLLLQKALETKHGLSKPRVAVCVPVGITDVEKRAVEEAVIQSGAKTVLLLEEPMAAAIGAGLPVELPVGNMVVDIGGGTTEVAILSLGGIVVAKSLRVAGDAVDMAIVNYVKKAYNLTIGDRTAEEIKFELGSALPYINEGYYEVKGRDMATGLPKNIKLSSSEVRDAIGDVLKELVGAIVEVLEETPPELAADIMENGIMLTGGGALIRNLDRFIATVTGVPVKIAENPLDCAVIGTGKAFEYRDVMDRSLIGRRK
ncbi:MAG TPA: rod shape-determining protein [Candidatus Avimonoglobus intestinipullorum]|uniref:Cell shape-determining protein MreB n=1 Tax=Candidatus Avimonoglobus intestinipullorum TaxID=2840699 RepID=A0A9D1LVK0_9FIRM|nr:rod shape-determining protein [Candidatus Avimonoglobus intestinipullorum]